MPLCVCVCVCLLVNVSPGAEGNPTDTEGSPDCRDTQETDTEPQAATFPGAILLYFPSLYYEVDPFTSFRFPTTVNSLRTLRYLRTANLFTRHTDRYHLIKKQATFKHIDHRVMLRAIATNGITIGRSSSSFLFFVPGAAVYLTCVLLTLQCI
jgi:hypothetical protein